MDPDLASRIRDDIETAKPIIADFPTDWAGKKTVLEMKAADFQWRQMEWWAFYFEHLFFDRASPEFECPGDKLGRVTIDSRRSINWDLKAKAIKSDNHRTILNDCGAIDAAIAKDGAYGAIIGLCDVVYNDEDRSFQRWHQELKGGKSQYEIERESRKATSRYRKTHANLVEVMFITITQETLPQVDVMNQGRNSNGKPRPPKYMVNLERCDDLLLDRMKLDVAR